MMLGDRLWPQRLHLFTDRPDLAHGGAAELGTWLSEHPGCRLVIVDVLAALRDWSMATTNLYAADYITAREMKTVADERAVPMLALTHTRKQAASDALEMVSDSLG